MSPNARAIALFFLGLLVVILLASSISGCTHTPGKVRVVQNPLIPANCPELAAVAPETFGDTVKMLIDTDAQYNKCRTAALATPAQ